MLTERQMAWVDEFPHEATTENPVLYKYVFDSLSGMLIIMCILCAFRWYKDGIIWRQWSPLSKTLVFSPKHECAWCHQPSWVCQLILPNLQCMRVVRKVICVVFVIIFHCLTYLGLNVFVIFMSLFSTLSFAIWCKHALCSGICLLLFCLSVCLWGWWSLSHLLDKSTNLLPLVSDVKWGQIHEADAKMLKAKTEAESVPSRSCLRQSPKFWP